MTHDLAYFGPRGCDADDAGTMRQAAPSRSKPIAKLLDRHPHPKLPRAETPAPSQQHARGAELLPQDERRADR
jgi:hypothetical protein